MQILDYHSPHRQLPEATIRGAAAPLNIMMSKILDKLWLDMMAGICSEVNKNTNNYHSLQIITF